MGPALRPSLTACAWLLACASSAPAQTFTLDTDFAEGMQTLGLDLLIDAPVKTPVLISNYAFCASQGQFYALGYARLEPDDGILIGLVHVTKRIDGGVEVVIPDETDIYEDYANDLGEDFRDDYAYNGPSDRDLTLWTFLQTIPCSDWGNLADERTLLPVISIDGVTSMSALLAAETAKD